MKYASGYAANTVYHQAHRSNPIIHQRIHCIKLMNAATVYEITVHKDTMRAVTNGRQLKWCAFCQDRNTVSIEPTDRKRSVGHKEPT